MREGWLVRDGEVLASTIQATGWRGVVVTPRHFGDDVGAVVVSGPALVVGAGVAHLGEASRLRALSPHETLHVVAPGRQAIALRRELVARVTVGDDLQFRVVP